MEWSTACLDWRERIVAGRSLIPFAPLFPAEAEAAMEVFSGWRIVDAPSSPTFGEIGRSWVKDFAAAVFGAYDSAAGRRLIREFMLSISKKNSKSTLAAAIMLTALMRNWRLSGEFLIIAPTLEVANNSFVPAADMVAADDDARDLLHVQAHLKTITHRRTGASLKVIAADNETVSGKKAIGVFIDELWLFGKRANAENMLREATGGLVSRPEGFVIYATTQSDEPPAGVFRQKLRYFRSVRDGTIVDPKSLGVLYEFPEAMLESKAYLDPANAYVTNPNIGASVDREWLADELHKAQDAGEESLRGFLAKHLNVEVGLAVASDRWAGADVWLRAVEPELTLKVLIDRCDVLCVGLDGGGLDDLFGLAVIGRDKGTRHWLAWGRAWGHACVRKRRKAIVSRLDDFAKAGDFVWYGETPEWVAPPIAPPADDRLADLPVEIAAACEIILELDASGKLALVGLDPAGVGAIVDALAAIEICQDADKDWTGKSRVVGVSQGWRLQGAIQTVEKKLANGTLAHAAQPLMDWCAGNAKVEQKGNAMLITKLATGVAKIDPLMALFDAAALMATNPEAPDGGPSVYEDRGFLVV
jgi:phage terminase large subunit-like protein